jgi:hypothetical protein
MFNCLYGHIGRFEMRGGIFLSRDNRFGVRIVQVVGFSTVSSFLPSLSPAVLLRISYF